MDNSTFTATDHPARVGVPSASKPRRKTKKAPPEVAPEPAPVEDGASEQGASSPGSEVPDQVDEHPHPEAPDGVTVSDVTGEATQEEAE